MSESTERRYLDRINETILMLFRCGFTIDEISHRTGNDINEIRNILINTESMSRWIIT